MATRLTPFWPRPATTSGSLWPGSGLCALCSGPLSGSSHTAAAPLHHKLKRLNSLFHRRLARVRVQFGERLEQLDLFRLGPLQLEHHALILGGFSCFAEGPDRTPYGPEFTLQALASNLFVHASGHR